MNTLLEPSDENIDQVASKPGTTYFFVYPHNVGTVRNRIYAALHQKGDNNVHTSYDNVRRVLRVVVSE